jgi:hypothetical protein
MKISHILIIIIIAIVISFLLSKTSSYRKPRIECVRQLEPFTIPNFSTDYPSAFDKKLSDEETLYREFAR